ncbi:MAG: hypothetical protein JWO03_1496 [Bacteroidetes bacterium]|nr:hypothetical protein [Bacteroidota bacterium]
MKKIAVLFILILFVSLCCKAKEGLYLTYNDFKTGNLLVADSNSINVSVPGSPLTCTIKGEKYKYKREEVFGIMHNGTLCKWVGIYMIPLYAYGNCCIWHLYGVSAEPKSEGVYNFWFVSENLQGELYILKSYSALQKLVQKHPKLQSLSDCTTQKLSEIADKRWHKVYVNQISPMVERCINQNPGWIRVKPGEKISVTG